MIQFWGRSRTFPPPGFGQKQNISTSRVRTETEHFHLQGSDRNRTFPPPRFGQKQNISTYKVQTETEHFHLQGSDRNRTFPPTGFGQKQHRGQINIGQEIRKAIRTQFVECVR
jgi:hypothetical protein